MKRRARRNPPHTRQTTLLLASVALGVLLAVAGQAADWNPYMYIRPAGQDSSRPAYPDAAVPRPLEGFIPADCAYFPETVNPSRPTFNAVWQRIRYTPDFAQGPGAGYESYLKNNAGITEHVHDPYTGKAATPNRYRVIAPHTKDVVPCLPTSGDAAVGSSSEYGMTCSQADVLSCLPLYRRNSTVELKLIP